MKSNMSAEDYSRASRELDKKEKALLDRIFDVTTGALVNYRNAENAQTISVDDSDIEVIDDGDIEVIDDASFSLAVNFDKEYDEWDKKSPLKHFVVGNTSKALLSIGIDNKPIIWDSSKIIKIKKNHPEMTDEIIKKVPSILEHPIVIMQSKNSESRITMFGEVYANGNKPVLVVLELHPTKNNVFLDEIKIASAYQKDKAQNFINSSNILYIDDDKKRVDNWSLFTGLQLPVNNNYINSTTTVPQNDKGVNNNSMQDDEIKSSNKENTKSYSKRVDSEGKALSEGQAEYFKDSKVRDENGNLLVVYHGTVNDFTVFDRSFGSVEGDWGKGFYFTNEYDDVKQNYASEEGPDLKNKIERYAERIEDNYEDFDEALEVARKHFITAEPNIIEAYLNIENPLYVGDNEAFFEYDEHYDEETDDYDEPEGLLVDFVEALEDNIGSFDTYGYIDFWNALGDGIYNGGMYISDIVDNLNNNLLDEVLDENGDIAVKELIRLALEDMGYDGIIDTSVSEKFRTMSGMYDTTTHYIAFNSNQAKLTDNLNPTENEDIRFSRRVEDFSYGTLTSKADMPITVIDDSKDYTPNKQTRENIIENALKSALRVGHKDKSGNTYVYVNDIDTNILVSKRGLRHSLDRRLNIIAPVTENIGSILKNSIEINELIPEFDTIEKSYVLIGIAKNAKNEPYVVSFVVNSASNEITSVDVLYAVNAKTEPAGSLSPELSSQSDVSLTGSEISISDLLNYVNKYYPDVLPEDVLKHYNHTRRPDGKLGESALFSRRVKEADSDSVLNDDNEKFRDIMKKIKSQRDDINNLKYSNIRLEQEAKPGSHISLTQAKAINSEIKKKYNSKLDSMIGTKDLMSLYDMYANEAVSINKLNERALEVAKGYLLNVKEEKILDSYSQEVLNRLKDTKISLSDAQISEINYLYGSVSEFKKKLGKGIRITNDGMALDEVWSELSKEYPGTFDADASDVNQPGYKLAFLFFRPFCYSCIMLI